MLHKTKVSNTTTQYGVLIGKKFRITFSVNNARVWVRLFGLGFKIESNKQPLSFSQRNDYSKFIQIGKYRVSRMK